MFSALKQLNLERMDIDEAIALYVFGKSMQAEYTALKIPAPQWLTDNVESLKGDIGQRRKDTLRKRKKEIEARLDGLKSSAQKQKDLRKELAEIDVGLA